MTTMTEQYAGEKLIDELRDTISRIENAERVGPQLEVAELREHATNIEAKLEELTYELDEAATETSDANYAAESASEEAHAQGEHDARVYVLTLLRDIERGVRTHEEVERIVHDQTRDGIERVPA